MDAKKLHKKLERQKKKAKAGRRKHERIHGEQKLLTNGNTSTTIKRKLNDDVEKMQMKKIKTDAYTIEKKNDITVRPVQFHYKGSESYLTPKNPEFKELLDVHYQGFVHQQRDEIDNAFHQLAKQTFIQLYQQNYFQYDVVMAGGKNLSRTFVRRTLVGEPGITYKYLGLRIFAHSWRGPNVAPLFRQVRKLNNAMIDKTKQLESGVKNKTGSCDYNLTLINYMEPITNWDLGLKDEGIYNLGKTSVSWHADSSLQDFSAIGVYNCMMDTHLHGKNITKKIKQKQSTPTLYVKDWRIALRISPTSREDLALNKMKHGTKPLISSKANTPPPAVVMPTCDGDAYFLIGDFNHDHQHAVLTGSNIRVSSTHRVAVEDDSTLLSIQVKLDRVLASISENKEKIITPQLVREEQSALTEVEMEWIRQYWLQGKKHDDLHQDWQKPIRHLEQHYWLKLELRTKLVYDLIIQGNSSNNQQTPYKESKWTLSDRLKVLNVLLQELIKRQKWRDLFSQRMADKAYRRVALEFQPLSKPSFNASSPMKKDLSAYIKELESLRSKLKASRV